MRYDRLHRDEIDCRKFKARLDSVLDERQDPETDSELDAHIQSCPSCADWMAAHIELLEAMPNDAAEASDDSILRGLNLRDAIRCALDFALRVLQVVEGERQRQNRWRRWRIASLAVAAGLMIAVLNWRWPDVGGQMAGPPDHPVASLPMAQLADFAGDISTQQKALVGNMAEGFKPVTTSVNTAINTLLRALPVAEIPPHVL